MPALCYIPESNSILGALILNVASRELTSGNWDLWQLFMFQAESKNRRKYTWALLERWYISSMCIFLGKEMGEFPSEFLK